ncbi:hypothetical protein AO262_10695 [Pseudomonas fluorescens ABAC62]|nr:hypothetical protein AO262_10695 [Pseudomonas fluorescens ABAC62]
MLFSYRGALRVGLVYLLVSIVWLQLSDQVLINFLDEPRELGHWLQLRSASACARPLLFSIAPAKACWSPMPRA